MQISNDTSNTPFIHGNSMQTRLGLINIYPQNIYKLEFKILGFYNDENFVISPMPGAPDDSPFFLMQSLDHQDVCFILLNSTFEGDPVIGYTSPLLLKSDVEQVCRDLCEEKLQYAFIVSNNPSMKNNMSMNTMAPIFFNIHKKKGWQVILNNPIYNVCEPLF